MKTISMALLLSFHTLLVLGQNTPARNENWQSKFFNSPKEVLPKLINAAIKNSTELEKLGLAEQIAQDQSKLTNKKILNRLSLGTNYSYGTTYNFINGDTPGSGGGGGINPFSLPTQSQYNVGLSLGMSLGELLSRPYEKHQQQLMIKQVQADRVIGEKEIRKAMIAMYQEVVLANTELKHIQEALQTANVNKKISERRFKNGEVMVSEQMAADDMYSKAVLSEVQARSQYQTALLLLEETIGMTINELMQGK